MHGNSKDLTGKRFGRLVVIAATEERQHRKVVWKCKCDCGNESYANSGALLSGRTRSCGCLMHESRGKSRITHHKSKSRLYVLYNGIKARCLNPNNKAFKWYGGKGIKICDEWLNDFQAFYEWAMANGYAKGLTIDRIDSEKDYCPENCRWITIQEQQHNKKSNHYITCNGETHTMTEWAKKTGININTLSSRINKLHWTPEKALGMNDYYMVETPVED